VGAEEEARTKQELAASLKELAALEKAIAEQSEELQRLCVERTRLSRGVTDLLGRVRGSTTLQLLSDVRGSTLE
jgi:septal ring factor EnvC (AmiA/AmiB activator)